MNRKYDCRPKIARLLIIEKRQFIVNVIVYCTFSIKNRILKPMRYFILEESESKHLMKKIKKARNTEKTYCTICELISWYDRTVVKSLI
uniref:Uncharacterized protein n=1 Tax=Romanomermis culicivorax TaxID=13658 RepID=A0A915ID96_ROMCU